MLTAEACLLREHRHLFYPDALRKGDLEDGDRGLNGQGVDDARGGGVFFKPIIPGAEPVLHALEARQQLKLLARADHAELLEVAAHLAGGTPGLECVRHVAGGRGCFW